MAPVREASRTMVRELGFLDSGTRELEMPHTDCHALIELQRTPGLTAGELAEMLRLDKSTTSRVVGGLIRRQLARAEPPHGDRRRRPLVLTTRGQLRLDGIHAFANKQVQEALALLSPDERRAVAKGISLYAHALSRRRAQAAFTLRPIEPKDDPSVAKIIRTVMPEFGAQGPGFAINDPEVDWMSRAYRGKSSTYLVVEKEGRVVGGGGFGPLKGAPRHVCELRKMYFLPEARGSGMGRRLLGELLDRAKAAGFTTCYLETLKTMVQARRLYESAGFRPTKSMGATGHFGCDAQFIKSLA